MLDEIRDDDIISGKHVLTLEIAVFLLDLVLLEVIIERHSK